MRGIRTAARLLAVLAVVTAGTAGIARAAGLAASSPDLGAGRVALPSCAAGSIALSGSRSGISLSAITSSLSSCSGAAAGDIVYVGVDNTTQGSDNGATCALGGSPVQCTATLNPAVYYHNGDSYTIEILATPAAPGSPATGGNHLTLTSDYLLLGSCVVTGSQLTSGTTC